VSGETAAWLLNDVDELSAIYDKVQSLTRFAGLVLLASFCWPRFAGLSMRRGPTFPSAFRRFALTGGRSAARAV